MTLQTIPFQPTKAWYRLWSDGEETMCVCVHVINKDLNLFNSVIMHFCFLYTLHILVGRAMTVWFERAKITDLAFVSIL